MADGLEERFLIGWRDFPLDNYNTCEPITNLPGSEHMIADFAAHQWGCRCRHVEAELKAYTRVRSRCPSTQNPGLLWWKQHVQEFPRFARMARQYVVWAKQAP